MTAAEDLRIEIFADGADEASIERLAADPRISGFTTNPTLMRSAGVSDYETFGRKVLEMADGKPISFEVFADDFETMETQARKLAGWGEGVFVKIPITNTQGESSAPLLSTLSQAGVRLNVTAILTPDQVEVAAEAVAASPAAIISVFAGRIADTGLDPIPLMQESLRLVQQYPNERLLWASTRELLNVIQADAIGCHIITVTPDILKKLPTLGKDLHQLSLATVKQFYEDAAAAGYAL